MTEPTLFNRIRLMRAASAIERCHVRPHPLRYSNGHHTHDVLSLFIQCWREAHGGALPRAEAMVAVHVHDKGEIVTGDVPSPIKDLLGEALHEVDARVEEWLRLSYSLTDEERLYLNAADRFELWVWCWEEAARGNETFLDWARSYEASWRENPLPEPFMVILEQVRTEGGLPHLTRDELNKAGGLS